MSADEFMQKAAGEQPENMSPSGIDFGKNLLIYDTEEVSGNGEADNNGEASSNKEPPANEEPPENEQSPGEVPQKRGLDEIAKALIQEKANADKSFWLIGKLLLEAKAFLIKRGQWLKWLKEVGLKDRTAQRYMRLAENYSSAEDVTKLGGCSNALEILDIPETRREDFINRKHLTKDIEKSVADMSVSELKKAIRDMEQESSPGSETEAANTENQARSDGKSINFAGIDENVVKDVLSKIRPAAEKFYKNAIDILMKMNNAHGIDTDYENNIAMLMTEIENFTRDFRV